MRYSFLTVALIALAGLIEGAALDTSRGRLGSSLVKRQKASPTCLKARDIQSASAKTGQEEGTEGIKPGQAPSATDEANFINFCDGQTITNGEQILEGSCNGIPMGKIPAAKNMISAMIANPLSGGKIPELTSFNIEVQTTHLNAGFFVNPTTNYYTAPQDIDENGDIIGHCHVTVQDIGSLKSTTPPDPNKFAFFKGIDDAGNGKGLLKAVVTGGLPAGVYRVCTMIAARNHQPVNMPVAQRGAQDDCNKFEVVAGGGGAQDDAGQDDSEGDNADAGNEGDNVDAGNGGKKANNGNDKGQDANAGAGNGGKKANNADKDNNAQDAAATDAAKKENEGKKSSSKASVKSGTLGGAAPVVADSGDAARPFEVNGNTFVEKAAAVQRSCDIQFNACADAANSEKLSGKTVGDCQDQKNSCGAA